MCLNPQHKNPRYTTNCFTCRAAVKRAEAKSRLRSSSSPLSDSQSSLIMGSSSFKPYGGCLSTADKQDSIFSKVFIFTLKFVNQPQNLSLCLNLNKSSDFPNYFLTLLN